MVGLLGHGFLSSISNSWTSKKERKEETKNLRKLEISNESKAKCGVT